MRLHTASEIVSLVKKLETESAKSYRDLSQKQPKHEDVFLYFAKENERNVVQIERAYYGVITDAIEGCFAFDIETDEYAFETAPPEATYPDALEKAIEMEEKIIKLYSDMAQQSKPLMADVPRAFAMIAKKRSSRPTKLRAAAL